MTPFQLAQQAWHATEDLRNRRKRYLRYTYGRQWDDPAASPRDGATVSEAVAARQQGQIPQTNNLIRQLIKCVIGNFRSSLAENDTAGASSLPDEIVSRNQLIELDCRMLEEFLISGCAIQRIVCESRPAGAGAWIDNVSPDNFFVNRFHDPRGLDIELIGMLHSMSRREIQMRYASKLPQSAERINRAYASTDLMTNAAVGSHSQSRFTMADDGRCRVIEVWTLESRNMIRCHDPHEMRLFLAESAAMPQINALNARRLSRAIRPVNTAPFTSLR